MNEDASGDVIGLQHQIRMLKVVCNLYRVDRFFSSH